MWKMQLFKNAVSVEGDNIFIVAEIIEADVRHADFLSLIDERRATLQNIHCRKRLTAQSMIFSTAIAADNSGMIMIFKIQRIPRLSF
ncbi:hypothetical protein SDC9_183523 [bioreactor metagenome]|uniref:Uncharacterized protein n=1 Tax=bioreactor metagenome TaxID=1076179 RepID=A0A645HAG5_9ZZZZ